MTSDELKYKKEEEWKDKLSPEQFRVMREKGTEPPFSGALLHNKKNGIYSCSACGNSLFYSYSKFDSGTGWPSFDSAIAGSVELKQDRSLNMWRVEVLCARCGSHLGHLFHDGPTSSGLRYCINSVCLRMEETGNITEKIWKKKDKVSQKHDF